MISEGLCDLRIIKTGVKADKKSDLHHWNKLHKKNIKNMFNGSVCIYIYIHILSKYLYI